MEQSTVPFVANNAPSQPVGFQVKRIVLVGASLLLSSAGLGFLHLGSGTARQNASSVMVSEATDLTAVSAVSAAASIAFGFIPDVTDPTFLRPAGLLFSFEQDTDYTIVDAPQSTSFDVSSDSAEAESAQIAASLNLDGSNNGPFAFAASVTSSSHSSSNSSVRTMRLDHSIKVRIKRVLTRGNPMTWRQKLAPGVEEAFNTLTPDAIYQTWGPYHATSMDVGGLLRTTVIRELRSTESASTVGASMTSSISDLTASAASSGSGTVTRQATETCGKTTVTNLAIGGDVQLWLGQAPGADTSAIQRSWSRTVNDNMASIGFALEPLSSLIRLVNASQANAFDEYCSNRWMQEKAAAHQAESRQSFAPRQSVVYDSCHPLQHRTFKFLVSGAAGDPLNRWLSFEDSSDEQMVADVQNQTDSLSIVPRSAGDTYECDTYLLKTHNHQYIGFNRAFYSNYGCQSQWVEAGFDRAHAMPVRFKHQTGESRYKLQNVESGQGGWIAFTDNWMFDCQGYSAYSLGAWYSKADAMTVTLHEERTR